MSCPKYENKKRGAQRKIDSIAALIESEEDRIAFLAACDKSFESEFIQGLLKDDHSHPHSIGMAIIRSVHEV